MNVRARGWQLRDGEHAIMGESREAWSEFLPAEQGACCTGCLRVRVALKAKFLWEWRAGKRKERVARPQRAVIVVVGRWLLPRHHAPLLRHHPNPTLVPRFVLGQQSLLSPVAATCFHPFMCITTRTRTTWQHHVTNKMSAHHINMTRCHIIESDMATKQQTTMMLLFIVVV